MQGVLRWLALMLIALQPALAMAEYAEECREFADKLARAPGSLTASEIELLKTCLAGLQRSMSLGEAVAPTPPAPEKICPPLPPEKECPVCAPPPVCPKVAPARERERDRESAVDPLRPQLQRF
jgi:hypothetical protein